MNDWKDVCVVQIGASYS